MFKDISTLLERVLTNRCKEVSVWSWMKES